MTDASDTPAHPLTDHFAWLERLALRLADDHDQADDLVQETWLAALRGPRRDVASPRAFLHRILQRTLYQRRRSERRRRDHEALVDAPDPTPAADEALERAEIGQELTRQVLALDEPYRAAILLRYASGLTPMAIAERQGLPLATVKSHLARGRALLRDDWRRQHPGADHTWLASLALLIPQSLRTPPPVAPTTFPSAFLGALLVHTKSITAVAVFASCAALLWFVVDLPGSSAGPQRNSVTRSDAEPAEVATGETVVRPTTALATERTAAAVTPRTPEPHAVAGSTVAAVQTFHGRVVNPLARPVAGIDVTFESGGIVRARTPTDGLGRFELEAPHGAGSVQVANADVVNLFVFLAPARASSDTWLVVAPYREIAGQVVDDGRRPIPGAHVEFMLPPDFKARFDGVFDSADELRQSTTTDADGRFAMERVPIVDGAVVRASLDGFETENVPAPAFAIGDLELALRQREVGPRALRGRVVDAYGEPVGGALVSLGKLSAASARDGTFRLDRAGALAATTLVAIARGFLPGSYEATVDAESEQPAFPDWVELRLGEEPFELVGRVVDETGVPRAGIELWLNDPTSFGTIEGDVLAQVEFLTAPAASTYDRSSDAYFRSVTTDADGRFRIQGLLEREYMLKLLDKALLYTEIAGPFAAGRRDVEIVLPRPGTGTVDGRVISSAGKPLADVRVQILVHAYGGVSRERNVVTTGEDGLFSFTDVGAATVLLTFRGEGIVPDHREVTRAEGKVELIVDALCHFKVDLSDAAVVPDHVGARDIDGGSLGIHDIGAGGYTRRTRSPLTGGRSGTLGLSEKAVALDLYVDGERVGGIDLRLEPGRLVLVTQ